MVANCWYFGRPRMTFLCGVCQARKADAGWLGVTRLLRPGRPFGFGRRCIMFFPAIRYELRPATKATSRSRFPTHDSKNSPSVIRSVVLWSTSYSLHVLRIDRTSCTWGSSDPLPWRNWANDSMWFSHMSKTFMRARSASYMSCQPTTVDISHSPGIPLTKGFDAFRYSAVALRSPRIRG